MSKSCVREVIGFGGESTTVALNGCTCLSIGLQSMCIQTHRVLLLPITVGKRNFSFSVGSGYYGDSQLTQLLSVLLSVYTIDINISPVRGSGNIVGVCVDVRTVWM